MNRYFLVALYAFVLVATMAVCENYSENPDTFRLDTYHTVEPEWTAPEPAPTTTTVPSAEVTSPPEATTTSTTSLPAPKPSPVVTASPTTTTTVPVAPAPKPAPTTTTTLPSKPPANPILETARADVGRPVEDFGVTGFWCAVYVEDLLARHGFTQRDPWGAENVRPSWLHQTLAPTATPKPGDVVFFSFQAGSGQADHVAIVESVDPLVVIDGNGASEDFVGRWSPTYEVLSYATF